MTSISKSAWRLASVNSSHYQYERSVFPKNRYPFQMGDENFRAVKDVEPRELRSDIRLHEIPI